MIAPTGGLDDIDHRCAISPAQEIEDRTFVDASRMDGYEYSGSRLNRKDEALPCGGEILYSSGAPEL
ncbi:MAG: hypothetical protein LC126_01865 [Bryobacterales bacterium]|nr:hypothetical protein [Bryobacterales bacterium]